MKQYERVQLFSGGGSRFGYYLGSYACLYDKGLAPDLILATCGGSLAALLVDIAPDSKDLYALVQSRALYDVVSASQAKAVLTRRRLMGHGLPDYVFHALKRWYLSSNSERLKYKLKTDSYGELLEELHQLSMFEIRNEPQWLDKLITLAPDYLQQDSYPSSIHTGKPEIGIIASRLCATNNDAHRVGNNITITHNAQVRLQQILFAPNGLKQRAYISKNLAIPSTFTFRCPTYKYAPKRLLPHIKVIARDEYETQNGGWDIGDAVRASMADMYYLTPIHVENLGWCLGGVIDLLPIELAAQLGKTVFAETKAPYDKIVAVPAIKRVFGFDANQRLQAVESYTSASVQIHWLPFADNGKILARQHVVKKIKPFKGELSLIHPSFDIFQQHMQAQWQYGYQRTLSYLTSNSLIN